MSRTEEGLRTGGGTALDSVRRLEERLGDTRGVEEAARARVAAAREEAERHTREAREAAENEAAERRRVILDRADGEAAHVIAAAEARVGALRRLAEDDRGAAAREVVALILPHRDA